MPSVGSAGLTHPAHVSVSHGRVYETLVVLCPVWDQLVSHTRHMSQCHTAECTRPLLYYAQCGISWSHTPGTCLSGTRPSVRDLCCIMPSVGSAGLTHPAHVSVSHGRVYETLVVLCPVWDQLVSHTRHMSQCHTAECTRPLLYYAQCGISCSHTPGTCLSGTRPSVRDPCCIMPSVGSAVLTHPAHVSVSHGRVYETFVVLCPVWDQLFSHTWHMSQCHTAECTRPLLYYAQCGISCSYTPGTCLSGTRPSVRDNAIARVYTIP